MTTSRCDGCGEFSFLLPLHGEKGGPPRCPLCIGRWHGEHGRRRNRGRVVIRAIKGFIEGGGNWGDIEKLKLTAMGSGLFDLDPLGYMAGAANTADEVIELTSELLADALNLVHPDLHPPERKEMAHRVTSQLLALKPFVFAAQKPKAPEKPSKKRPRYDSSEVSAETRKEPSRPKYPCPDCADTSSYFYCDACRSEWERRLEEERQRDNAKQRKWYAERKERRERLKPPMICATCGTKFQGKRKDARYCSGACRQKAHRKAPITDKSKPRRAPLSIRDGKRLILIALDRHQAVFLNDLLPPERTTAEYQALCRASRVLEDCGEIESFRYRGRFNKPGFLVLMKPGHRAVIENDDGTLAPAKIPRLEPDEQTAIADQCKTERPAQENPWREPPPTDSSPLPHNARARAKPAPEPPS
jgi:hypothetical protein